MPLSSMLPASLSCSVGRQGGAAATSLCRNSAWRTAFFKATSPAWVMPSPGARAWFGLLKMCRVFERGCHRVTVLVVVTQKWGFLALSCPLSR